MILYCVQFVLTQIVFLFFFFYSYSRNVMHLHCPLLMRGIPYYELEWQMVRLTFAYKLELLLAFCKKEYQLPG